MSGNWHGWLRLPPSEEFFDTPYKTRHMQFNKTNSIFFVPALLVVFAGLFYWYEYRPTEIRRECSWSPYSIPAKEASAGVTKEEAVTRCLQNLSDFSKEFTNDASWESFNRQACMKSEAEPPRPAELERTAWRQATDKEYTQCLRNNGL